MSKSSGQSNARRRVRQGVTIGVFCAIVLACTLISLLKPDTAVSQRENRVLAQMPDPDLGDILDGSFQSDYETYLNDQFFLRDTWVDVSTATARLLGKTDLNGVYLGRQGYLLEKYTDEDFDVSLVLANADYLADFVNDMANRYGSEHVDVLMVPSKAGALPDLLPAGAVPYPEEEAVSALEERLYNPDLLLDLTDTLRAHQDEYIYYRTDHHWTTLGAYYAYAAFAARKGYEVPSPESYTRETVAEDFLGTTYNKLHANVTPDTVTLFHFPAEQNVTVDINRGKTVSDSFYFPEELEDSDKYRVFFGGNTAQIEVTTQAGTGRTLLLLKDSFSNCFVPFLSGDYDTILMIDLRYYKDTLADLFAQRGEEITDVLVMYNVEKFMQDDGLGMLAYR